MMRKANNAQVTVFEIADAAYPDGLIGLYWKKPSQNHGDTLAKFIAIELAEVTQGYRELPEALEQAERAMASARREIEAVRAALEAARNSALGR